MIPLLNFPVMNPYKRQSLPGEPQVDSGEGGVQVDGNIEYDISEIMAF